MANPITVNSGDPCPQCGGPVLPLKLPTDAQRAAAADRDNPIPLNPHVDTAPADVVADKGQLHRCLLCGWQMRFKAVAAFVWPLTEPALESLFHAFLAKHGITLPAPAAPAPPPPPESW